MSLKKYSSLLLIFFMILAFADDSTAQRRGTKKRKSRDADKKEEKFDSFSPKLGPFYKDRMLYEIGFGNPTFLGANGGAVFNIALKPGIGYKVFDRLGTGLFIKGDYTWLKQSGQSFTLFDYGVGTFAKFKIIDILYLRGEFLYQSYGYDSFARALIREGFLEGMLGAGYRNGYGNWVFGGELLFHLNGDVQDYSGQIYEFWIKVDYNF